MGYLAGDGVRQQFTQKERDIETGLDFFEAKYYDSVQGRFTNPDPLLASGISAQPHSWNRYSYCLNKPLNYVDPNGLIWQTRTTVKDNVSTTEYKWVWQDDPEEGWERVTDFWVDIVGADGQTVGLHLNPIDPRAYCRICSSLTQAGGCWVIKMITTTSTATNTRPVPKTDEEIAALT